MTLPNYSFSASCKVVSDWWNNEAAVPGYCDEEGYAMSLADTEEAGEETGSRPIFYTVDRNAVKAALFGRLAPYL